jgi:hypothetical protein
MFAACESSLPVRWGLPPPPGLVTVSGGTCGAVAAKVESAGGSFFAQSVFSHPPPPSLPPAVDSIWVVRRRQTAMLHAIALVAAVLAAAPQGQAWTSGRATL